MTLFTKNFIISFILVLVFFFNQPLSAAADRDLPRGNTKKTLKQSDREKKTKRSTRTQTSKNKIKQKIKKATSKKKKKKAASGRRRPGSGVMEVRSAELSIQPPVTASGGSLQELVENEIIHLKNIGRLLPADQVSLQVYDLNEKRMLADINGNVIRNAASLIKLFVMLAVYDSISRQEIQETPEIEHQIFRMIAVSDNGATNSLIRRLGQGDALQGIIGINALTHKMGFSGSRLRELIPDGGRTYENQTTAADTTLFFRLLYEQKLVTPHYSQKMNNILLKSIHDRIKTHQISKDGVAVADKTGYVRGLNGDCGIVYLKGQGNGCNDYVLSIIIENKTRPTDGGWGRKKSTAIRYLSDRIYQNLRNGQGKS
ncbi:MAG: serine hydrolase [Deltaproteobacteria bacterium]|nr:serine hydrolase [Deltaproteobacteria bacterium]